MTLMYLYYNICLDKEINYKHMLSVDNLDDYTKIHQEVLKSIMCWQQYQSILKSTMDDAFSDIESIDFIKERLSKGPMELSIRDYEFFSVKQGHAVVAYKLYQDVNNSSIYYLELYDNVAPGSSSFVKIEKCPI